MARSRIKTKGRADFGSYVALPHLILESAEYAALSAHEVKLLIDVYAQFSGKNNGALSCSWTLMKQRGWHSQDTLNRAMRGLLERGFLIKTRQGGRHLASLFAVSWRKIDDCDGRLDVSPTNTPPGTWKLTSLIREPEHITTPTGAINHAQ